MSDPHAEFWNRLLAAEAPDATEMAAVEAELERIAAELPVGNDQVLPPSALQELATAPMRRREAPTGVAVPDEAAPSRTRGALVATALAVGLVSLGWVGRQMVWQSQANSTDQLNLVTTLDVLNDPSRTAEARRIALFQLFARLKQPALAVKAAAADADDQVRNLACALVEELQAGLAGAPLAAGSLDLGCEASVTALSDRMLPTALRVAALQHLGTALRAGITALNGAELTAVSDRSALRQRLAKVLASPIAGR